MCIKDRPIENIDDRIADLNVIARIGYWEFDVDLESYRLDKVSYDILQLPYGAALEDQETETYCQNKDEWAVVSNLIATTAKKKKPFHHEVELELPDGNHIWLLLIGKISYDTNRNIKVSGMMQDITDRKEFETELTQKNELLNFTENKAGLGHWKWDLKTDLVSCSKNIARIIGVAYGTVVTIQELINGVHPEDLELVRNHLGKAVKTKSFDPLFHRFLLDDGSERTIEVLGKPVLDDSGKLVSFICSSQDITTRKQFENELIKKNQLFIVAQQRAKFGYWQWDPKTDSVNCSENMSRLLRIEENTTFPIKDLIKDVHPNDIDYVRSCLNKVVKTKTFNGFSHRIVLNDEIRYVKVYGKVNTDLNDEILNILGVSQDVTEQKKSENELLSKNQLLGFAEQISKIGNWQWNMTTNIIKWSTNLYRIFEIEENSEVHFDTYFGHVHPDDKEMVTTKINSLAENKNFESVIHRIVLDNGTIKVVELLATVNLDDSDNIIEMLGTLQDVSEQRSEEIKFRGLLESAPNATLIVGEGDSIQMINKQAELLFGYTPEELIGKNFEILVPSRFEEMRIPQKKKFFENPVVQEMDLGEDFFMKHKSGKEIPVKVTLGLLEIDKGLLISMAVRDITTEKLAERKILKAKEDLEVLTRELTAQNLQLADFTQITSHNLRAPVSNLNSLLDIYKMMDDEEERKELFEKFETVIAHLTLTLNTLINALSTKSNTSVECHAVSFSETFKKTEEILTAEIIRTKAIIKSDFSKVDSIQYHKIYLESIFQNLIGNALKYKSPERIPQIEVSSEMHNGKVLLKFKDNGLGIDLERHGDKIFGLNKVFHNHPEAKGIGLFMTKTQVEAMGGKISVSSKVDEGSTFIISFK
ncbi:hypothetical protein B4Q04_08680 [Zobellia sp. OII3]|uniref:PAS domain-containing sensor histidine kinase n=1 Tax=Zobellia sp. OII3 TaxID=2034520 RepID=UPI000B530BC8|nr:PAS domain S-box protein [Zobellia sp. OII3]OWW25671.1 hypothetical protein B4Q04_08680 [Zobellia sp. OII3]